MDDGRIRTGYHVIPPHIPHHTSHSQPQWLRAVLQTMVHFLLFHS